MLTPVSSTGQALPDAIISLLNPFAPMFQARTWSKVQALLVSAVLATRKRTVTSVLRVLGLSDDASFARHHHVLDRAEWSPLKVGRVLVYLLIQHLDQAHQVDPHALTPHCHPLQRLVRRLI